MKPTLPRCFVQFRMDEQQRTHGNNNHTSTRDTQAKKELMPRIGEKVWIVFSPNRQQAIDEYQGEQDKYIDPDMPLVKRSVPARVMLLVHGSLLFRRGVSLLYHDEEGSRISTMLKTRATNLGTPLLIGAQILTLTQPYELAEGSMDEQ